MSKTRNSLFKKNFTHDEVWDYCALKLGEYRLARRGIFPENRLKKMCIEKFISEVKNAS